MSFIDRLFLSRTGQLILQARASVARTSRWRLRLRLAFTAEHWKNDFCRINCLLCSLINVSFFPRTTQPILEARATARPLNRWLQSRLGALAIFYSFKPSLLHLTTNCLPRLAILSCKIGLTAVSQWGIISVMKALIFSLVVRVKVGGIVLKLGLVIPDIVKSRGQSYSVRNSD